MKINYKGWSINIFKQVYHPSFKPYVAICHRENKNHITIHNVEGISLNQAVIIAKDKIDLGEITTLPRNPDLIKPEFIS
jgi:ribosomal protein L2